MSCQDDNSVFDEHQMFMNQTGILNNDTMWLAAGKSDFVYIVSTLDKYYCAVTIGDDDPCRRHKIPHLWQLGAKKQYYSVIFSITAVPCNLVE